MDRQRSGAKRSRGSGGAEGAAVQRLSVEWRDLVADRVPRAVVVRLAQLEGQLVTTAHARHVQRADRRGVVRVNTTRCICVTAVTPERPLSWIHVTCGPTPSKVSLPPASLPLLAECTNTVPSRGGACADAGATAASQPARIATSPATVSRLGATQLRSVVSDSPL